MTLQQQRALAHAIAVLQANALQNKRCGFGNLASKQLRFVADLQKLLPEPNFDEHRKVSV